MKQLKGLRRPWGVVGSARYWYLFMAVQYVLWEWRSRFGLSWIWRKTGSKQDTCNIYFTFITKAGVVGKAKNSKCVLFAAKNYWGRYTVTEWSNSSGWHSSAQFAKHNIPIKLLRNDLCWNKRETLWAALNRSVWRSFSFVRDFFKQSLTAGHSVAAENTNTFGLAFRTTT